MSAEERLQRALDGSICGTRTLSFNGVVAHYRGSSFYLIASITAANLEISAVHHRTGRLGCRLHQQGPGFLPPATIRLSLRPCHVCLGYLFHRARNFGKAPPFVVAMTGSPDITVKYPFPTSHALIAQSQSSNLPSGMPTSLSRHSTCIGFPHLATLPPGRR